MRIVAEIRGDFSESEFRKISGVQSVGVAQGTQPECKIVTIESDGDIRAEVARVVVSSGAELLELGRDGDGLESIFMNLVRSSKAKSATGGEANG